MIDALITGLSVVFVLLWWHERNLRERARGQAAYEAWAAAREVRAAGLGLPSFLMPAESFNWDGHSLAYKEGVLIAQKRELLKLQARHEETRLVVLRQLEEAKRDQAVLIRPPNQKDYLQ